MNNQAISYQSNINHNDELNLNFTSAGKLP